MIQVLAGVNGAGKSSIGGAAIRAAGGDWYNPDAMAAALHQQFPQRSMTDINSAVWHEGHRRLQAAINADEHFNFETTLGGQSIIHTLLDAIAAGIKVNIWYCGLATADLHIERVAARVARGGHDIPAELIRKRCQTSIRNLCRLTPGLNQLALYDNSMPLGQDGKPAIRRLLHVQGGQILHLQQDMPDWAKPVAAVVMAQAE